MRYSRSLAVDFWYTFDREFRISRKAEYYAAYEEIGLATIVNLYRELRRLKKYPDGLRQYAGERRYAFLLLSRAQWELFDRFFGDDEQALQRAFEDFGQGVLLDEREDRAAAREWIHMIDADDDSVGFHRWHAFIRAVQELGDDTRWEQIDRFVALAWAMQSVAQPRQGPIANPGLPQAEIERLRRRWLVMPRDEIDRRFEQIGYALNP